MLNFDLYAIRTDDGFSNRIREYFSSVEDAIKGRFKYGNFYRPNGCGNIIKFKAGAIQNIEEEWKIDTNDNDKQVVVEYCNYSKGIHKKDYETGLDEWPIV